MRTSCALRWRTKRSSAITATITTVKSTHWCHAGWDGGAAAPAPSWAISWIMPARAGHAFAKGWRVIAPCSVEEEEVVELGPRVGLGPDAEASGRQEGRVLLVEVRLAVEPHDDAARVEIDGELVPAGGQLHRRARHDRARAGLHDVEAEVVLERIEAGEVVVVRALRPPDQPAALVDLSVERAEADAHASLVDREAGQEGDVEALLLGLAVLLQHARRRGRVGGVGDDPRAAARLEVAVARLV